MGGRGRGRAPKENEKDGVDLDGVCGGPVDSLSSDVSFFLNHPSSARY